MAMVRGNKPFGDPEIVFGQPNATFGDMWGDVVPVNEIDVHGGGDLEIEADQIQRVIEYDIVISSTEGGMTADLLLVFPHTGTPTRTEPLVAIGPSQAQLQGPSY